MPSESNGEQVTTNTPWSAQAPYINDTFHQANDLYYNGRPSAFPNVGVAPFSPQTQQSFDMTTQLANSGGQYNGMANSFLNDARGLKTPNMATATASANQAAGSIGSAQNMLRQGANNQFSNVGAARNFASQGSQPWENKLNGFTNGMSLGQTQNFAGKNINNQSLNAANNYVTNTLGKTVPSWQTTNRQLQSQLGGLDPTVQNELSKTASGGYLGSNPFLDAMYKDASRGVTGSFNETVLPGIANQLGGAGRTGSGAHAASLGRASGDLTDSLSGMSANIYGTAYDNERNRQQGAAGQLGSFNMQERGQDLQGVGMAHDFYNQGQNRQANAAALGGQLFSAANNADIARKGIAADLYSTDRGQAIQATTAGMQNNLQQNQLAGSLYNNAKNNQISAGNTLGQIGLGGIDAMRGINSDVLGAKNAAAGMIPGLQSAELGRIGALGQVGAQIEDQSQRLIDDQRARYEYGQNMPWQQLNNYASIANQSPGGGYGTQTSPGAPRGSRTIGAAGGALSGAAAGSAVSPGWGTLIGAGVGAIGGYYA